MTTPTSVALAALLLLAVPEDRPACHPDSQAGGIFAPDSSDSPVSPEQAQMLFEKMKALEGTWTGRSTKGWTEEVSLRVIAQGSVLQITSFDAHPNETMLTLVHKDLHRLVLTHYCVAKNQPRLKLSEISEDGNTAVFTFLDATNLSTRDKGHMDKVVYQFEDDDHFSSQWTWYQSGTERWLEKIFLERKR